MFLLNLQVWCWLSHRNSISSRWSYIKVGLDNCCQSPTMAGRVPFGFPLTIDEFFDLRGIFHRFLMEYRAPIFNCHHRKVFFHPQWVVWIERNIDSLCEKLCIDTNSDPRHFYRLNKMDRAPSWSRRTILVISRLLSFVTTFGSQTLTGQLVI